MRASLPSLLTSVAAAALALFGGQVAVAASATAMPAIRTGQGNDVPACVTPERLTTFLTRANRKLDPAYEEIARLYQIVGRAYQVRWDYAYFHMLAETNFLTFRRADGSAMAVAPAQFNLAALGAVGDGNPGEAFPDLTVGVQAHIEHILVYSGMKIANPVAERTRKVIAWGVLDGWLAGFDRPITYRDFALRWSPFSTSYSDNLAAIARKFFETHCPGGAPREAIVTADARAGSAGDGPRGSDRRQPSARQEPQSGQFATAWVGRSGTDGRLVTDAAEPGAQARIPAPRKARPEEVRAAAAPDVQPAPQPRAAARPPAGEPAAPRARPATVAAVSPKPSQPTATAPASRNEVQVASVAPDLSMAPRSSLNAPAPPAPPPEKSEDEKVRELVSGRTVELKADMGAIIPVQFRENGTVTGEAAGLAFFLGAARDRGKWWVENGRLCKRWRVWLDAKTMCLKLTPEGRTVHWVADDGRSGTATIVN